MWLVGCDGMPACDVENNTFLYSWPPVQVPCFMVGTWSWFAFRPISRSVERHARWRVALGHDGPHLRPRHGRTRRVAREGPSIRAVLAACSAAGFLLFACSRAGGARRRPSGVATFQDLCDRNRP